MATETSAYTYAFEILKVVDQVQIGSFLFWDKEKDLLLPLSEQTRDLQIGDAVVVAIFNDKQGRPCASMRIENYIDSNTSALKIEQEVDAIVYAKTDLGYKALINKRYVGLFYNNEVFQEMFYGQPVKAYVRFIREDGKVDLLLQPFGNKGADDLGLRILEALEDHNGFLPITDKSEAETIYKLFQVSKKKFKIALGGIYKKRLVTINDKGITLVKP